MPWMHATQALSNPLLQPGAAAHGLPPFDRIAPTDFEPAFEQAMADHRAELDAIGQQAAAPSFENTAEALDAAGAALKRLSLLFNNLCASLGTPALQALERVWAPRLAAHESAVLRHAGVFGRLDALHDARASLELDEQQARLLERWHLDFVRAGARLAPAAQGRCAEIVERLATLNTRFGQHVLADEDEWLLPLVAPDDLAGLPESVVAAARAAAQQRGHDGAVMTLSRSLVMPFLTYSTRGDLRERVWRAWTSRGELDAARDTRLIATEILALRLELARLHGYATYADYALLDRMAGRPGAVLDLLDRAWQPAVARAAAREAELQPLARELGLPVPLAPWDWRFLEQRCREREQPFDEAALKAYFSLDRMTQALFDCATRLFGVRFTRCEGLALYHPDVQAWAVTEVATGAPVGLFLADNFARPGKRGGAWMSVYRSQAGFVSDAARGATAIVVNNNNFAKAPAGQPTLLGFDDVRTLFHEFGHGLHGLLSKARYERLAGTQVAQDFVELPSQLFEHWALQPEVLQRHARHADTGEAMPPALMDALLARQRTRHPLHETVAYLASAQIDMALHALDDLRDFDLTTFEQRTRERLGVPAAIGLMHRPPHFRHLFSGDAYAAGYYVYLWAEVLDADAFEAFREAGNPFDPATAQRLLTHVYAAGNTVEPRATYRAFRGRDAQVEAMLKQRGLEAALA